MQWHWSLILSLQFGLISDVTHVVDTMLGLGAYNNVARHKTVDDVSEVED